MNNFSNTKYPLEERTSLFGEAIIRFCKILPKDLMTQQPAIQLLRSGTSIGANYMEANNASSKKDFTNKIFICKKEAQETKYWLRMLKAMHPQFTSELSKLHQEAQELTLIFQKITTTARSNKQ